jgi:hypothetical protein
MPKLDAKSLKPIQYNNRKVKDPIRYPVIIVPVENKMKILFDLDLNVMVGDLTKEMVKIKKGA